MSFNNLNESNLGLSSQKSINKSHNNSLQMSRIVSSQLVKHKKSRNQYLNLTNNILFIDNQRQKHQKAYYIPVYCKLILKNIVSLDFENLTGQVNVDIQLSVYYANFNQKQIKILEEEMLIRFPNTKSLKLNTVENYKNVQMQRDQQQRVINFKIDTLVDVLIINDVSVRKFQTSRLILSMNLKKIMKSDEHITQKYGFNFMDIQKEEYFWHKFQNKAENKFGVYNIAENKFSVHYGNRFSLPLKQYKKTSQYKMQKQEQQIELKKYQQQNSQDYIRKLQYQEEIHQDPQQIDPELQITIKTFNQKFAAQKVKSHNFPSILSFNTGHYTIFLYKDPSSMIVKVLLPVIILGIISLGVIYQENKQTAKKNVNLAAILVALIALIHSTRQNFTTAKGLTFSDIIIAIQLAVIVIAFVQMNHQNHEQNLPYYFYNSVYGLVCLGFILLNFILIVLFVIGNCFQLSRYSYNKKYLKKYVNNDFKKWRNIECDKQFINSYQFQRKNIKILTIKGLQSLKNSGK